MRILEFVKHLTEGPAHLVWSEFEILLVEFLTFGRHVFAFASRQLVKNEMEIVFPLDLLKKFDSL